MKTIGTEMKLVLSWLLVLSCLVPSHSRADDKVWVEFLTLPDIASHDALTEKLTKCSDSVCLKMLAPASSNLTKLLKLVRQGNPQAVDIAFRSTRFLDGGDLEDAHRELGAIAESRSELFLTQAKKSNISKRELRRVLRMLPLDTVDNVDKKRQVVKRRIENLSKVGDVSLQAIKEESVVILKQYFVQLEAVR